MKTEKVIAHAELAALYFRTLVEQGVPAMAAVSLTGSYVSSVVIMENAGEKPREPWQDGGDS